VADPPLRPAEMVEVAEQIPDGPRVEVLQRTHAEGALRLVVVPGEHVAAALLPERHREQQDRDRLAGPALRVDHGHLAEAAEVAADHLDVVPVFLLVPPRRQRDQAQRAFGDGAAHTHGGDGLTRARGPPAGEVVGGGGRPVRPLDDRWGAWLRWRAVGLRWSGVLLGTPLLRNLGRRGGVTGRRWPEGGIARLRSVAMVSGLGVAVVAGLGVAV